MATKRAAGLIAGGIVVLVVGVVMLVIGMAQQSDAGLYSRDGESLVSGGVLVGVLGVAMLAGGAYRLVRTVERDRSPGERDA